MKRINLFTAGLFFVVFIALGPASTAAQEGGGVLYDERNLPIGEALEDTPAIETVHKFPSADSTVVGSIGFIDDDEVGYFYSVSHSVTETFSGPNSITSYKLDVDVITNLLRMDNLVDWRVTINGVQVDTFTVDEGFTGTVSRRAKFSEISGPDYTVKMAVTNEVDPGAGSHTFRYAGSGSNDLELIEGGPWGSAYQTLFESSYDLDMMRAYRDDVLSKTVNGNKYTDLLYKSSEEALEVFLDNPELMAQAKALIEANKDAVMDVLDGYEGIIYNTHGIVAFLDAYASEAPPVLKVLVKLVKWDMVIKRRQGALFFGFRLE